MSKRDRACQLAITSRTAPFKSAWCCAACGMVAVTRFDPTKSATAEDVSVDLAQAHAAHHETVCRECHQTHLASYCYPLLPACIEDGDGDPLWVSELVVHHMRTQGTRA